MATNPAITTRLRDRRFYLYLAVFVAAVVFAGFAPTFYLNHFLAKLHLSSLLFAHGLIFSSWILLLIIQTRLISERNVALHRKLGYASIALIVLMLAVGTMAAIDSFHRNFTPPGGPPPIQFMVMPIFDMIVFATLVTAALLLRNRPETHKRLMLVATIGILPPATARILFHFTTVGVLFKAYGFSIFLILCCIAYDLVVRRKFHQAYLWGGLFFFLSIPARIMLSSTPAWAHFALWLSSLK